MADPRTYITKSKAGHYHVTVKGLGVSVKHPDLHDTLRSAQLAGAEVRGEWGRIVGKAKAPTKAPQRKYELVEDDPVTTWDGRKLFRIRAQVSGNAWVSGNAQVYGNAQVSGNAWVYGNASLGWLNKVGSENGTLTWFVTRQRLVYVSRGCFNGTIDEFEAAVGATHSDGRVGQEYRLLIQFIRLRAEPALAALPADEPAEAA